MAETDEKHLKKLLESFDTAMLITRHDDFDHARPMTVAGVDGTSTIWFATSEDAKSAEIRRDARAAATFQSRKRWVAVSGIAELVKDREKVHELWKPSWRVWFPKGKNDPSIVLLRLTVTDAEFWDNGGAKGIRYVLEALEALKALLSRRKPSMAGGQHARIHLVEAAAVAHH
jgi:general stress protein 26